MPHSPVLLVRPNIPADVLLTPQILSQPRYQKQCSGSAQERIRSGCHRQGLHRLCRLRRVSKLEFILRISRGTRC